MTQSRAIFLVGCAAMLGACNSVQTSLRPNDERGIARGFLAAVRPFRAALPMPLVDGEPRPSQVLTESQIRVTVEGHLSAVQTRDGSWIVQVPANGSARITAYSTTDGQSGAAMNVRGTNLVDIHTQQLALPFYVVPGDALVVTSTATGSRAAYWPAAGRSAIDEAMAVVFVAYAAIPGLLRPPAIGDGFLVRLLRSEPIPEAMVNTARLPNVIDVDNLPVNWAGWGAAKPDFNYLVALLQPFAGECYDGWSTDTRTPDFQHPGYGSDYASVVSQALVMLCSTAPAAQKTLLALAVTQRGLDLVGAFCDGRLNYPLGGHMQGRKALIITCGHLLGIIPFADPVTYIGPRFQEDGYFETTPSAWWFGAGWTAGWRFELPSPFDGSQLNNPPSTWGPVMAPQHDSWAWMVNGYMSTVLGSQVGTALAMHLMGRDREMGTAFYRMVHEWMSSPPTAAQAQISAVGIVLRWGTDYSVVRGAGLCRAAWIAAGL